MWISGFDPENVEGIAKEFEDGGWDYTNGCRRVIENSQVKKDLEGATVYVAWYGTAPYEGSAFVLYEKDGKLYEVHASHCSCYGLEDKWDPEETTWAALKLRFSQNDWTLPSESYDEGNIAKAELYKVIIEHLPA